MQNSNNFALSKDVSFKAHKKNIFFISDNNNPLKKIITPNWLHFHSLKMRVEV